MADENDYWSIAPKSLYDLVNDKRRMRNKTPIDHGTMQTRLVLKCSVTMPGALDFTAPELRLEEEQIPRLEVVVNELFDLYLDNELKRYCRLQSARPAFVPVEESKPVPVEETVKEEGAGLGGVLRRLFRR